jgi:hypothetical protein
MPCGWIDALRACYGHRSADQYLVQARSPVASATRAVLGELHMGPRLAVSYHQATGFQRFAGNTRPRQGPVGGAMAPHAHSDTLAPDYRHTLEDWLSDIIREIFCGRANSADEHGIQQNSY